MDAESVGLAPSLTITSDRRLPLLTTATGGFANPGTLRLEVEATHGCVVRAWKKVPADTVSRVYPPESAE